MSDADWDADDFEPVVKPAGPPKAFQDKWEGEDEADAKRKVTEYKKATERDERVLKKKQEWEMRR